jgi:hypothetical protein
MRQWFKSQARLRHFRLCRCRRLGAARHERMVAHHFTPRHPASVSPIGTLAANTLRTGGE